MQRELISYGRFSSKPQEQGDSKRRQSESYKTLLARHKDKGVVESTRYGFGKAFDEGLSAFHGSHLAEGFLGEILHKIETGEIKAGSVLGVEAIDRLTRLETLDAWELIGKIVRAGLAIAVFEPDLWLDRKTIDGPMGLVLMFLIQEARRKSAETSRRVHDARQARRDDGEVRTTLCPCWLVPVCETGAKIGKENWKEHPTIAPLLKEAIRKAIAGDGCDTIRRAMGKVEIDGKPALLGLATIFRQRTLIGEFCDRERKGKRKGKASDAIQGYYPALISEATFYDLQNALDSRNKIKGRRGEGITNLFPNLLTDKHGGSLWIRPRNGKRVKGGKRQLVRVLMQADAKRSIAEQALPYLRYEYVEKAVLRFIANDVKPSDLLPPVQDNGEIEALEGKVADYGHKVREINARLLESGGQVDTLLSALQVLDKARKAASDKLEALKRQTTSNEIDNLSEAKTVIEMLDSADKQERITLRTKLRSVIGGIVAGIRIDPQSITDARLTITLTSGDVGYIKVAGDKSECGGIQGNPPFSRKTA